MDINKRIFISSELVRIHVFFFIIGLVEYSYFPEKFSFNLGAAGSFLTIFLGYVLFLSKLLRINPEMIKKVIRNFSSTEIMWGGTEDFIFIFPLLFLDGGISIFIGILISMILFSSIHMQYDKKARVMVSFYIPIAYYFAINYGILTTVIGHAFYNYLIALYVKYVLIKEDSSYRNSLVKELEKLNNIVKKD